VPRSPRTTMRLQAAIASDCASCRHSLGESSSE
jgi:hypothetical protein